MHLNSKLDHVFQFLPIPSIILLPDAPKFTIVAANKAYLETANSLESDLIGKGIFEAFPENPEDSVSKGVENLRNSLNAVIAQQRLHKMPLQKYDIPIRGTSKFKVKYFNPQNIPIKDDNNNITHILHSVEDVTDLKNLEITFGTERQRFNDLFIQAPSCMGILKGPNHVFEFANNLYLKLTGVKDVIGKTVKEVLPELEAQGIIKFLDTVYETGESFSAKEMFIKYNKKGEEKIVEMYQDVFYHPHKDINGNIDGIFFFFIDVTERVASRKVIEESEKRLKQAQEIAHLGNWELNFETGICLWSTESCKIFGLSPKDNKQTYSSWLSFIHPEDIGAVMKLIDESNKTLSDLILNYRIISNDGTIKFLYGISKFECDINQKPIGLYGIVLDISERKRAEEKLKIQNLELDFQNKEKENRAAELFIANKELAYQNREKEKRAEELILANIELEFQNKEKENRSAELHFSNKELVKTNIELDHFVYSVSHDLRSPLTSILGLISLIEEESREPDTLEQAKMIRTSINRLDGFIKNILNYSQNNRTGLETQKIPIKKTINDIVNSVRNIKEANGISFQIDIDEQMPFYSDWHRFNTILENLVSNAIKHHTKKVPGRYLKLTGTVDKEQLKLSISDNGIGIDPEFHDKIFQMFYRLPGNTDGSGFGLYIVKETLEKMQGKIEIQSEKGVGTTFIVTLKNLKE